MKEKSKNNKYMAILIVLAVCFLSMGAVNAYSVNSHLDGTGDINVTRGEIATIESQLWVENLLGDTTGNFKDIYCKIYSTNQRMHLIYSSKEETEFPDGEVTFKVDTKRFPPGNYKMYLRFYGEDSFWGYINPCYNCANFTVNQG